MVRRHASPARLSLALALIMAIAFDVASPATKSNANVSSLTSGAYTVAGSNRYKVGFGGGTGTAGTTNFVQNLKWGGSGGTGFTALHAGLGFGSFSNLRLFGLLAPSASALTLFGDRSAAIDEFAIGALNYTGVDQTTPLANSSAVTTATGALSGTSTSCSITIGSGLAAGYLVVAAF